MTAYGWTTGNNTAISHIRLIDRGGFGEVHEMLNQQTEQAFARKLLYCGNVPSSDLETEVQAIIQIRRAGGHQNIVQILQYDWLEPGSPWYFIDMEYCHITLHDYIRHTPLRHPPWHYPTFTDPDADSQIIALNVSLIMFHIASGLEFLHSNAHVHRDLKPKNVLYSRHDDRWKLTDFGLTTPATSRHTIVTSQARGTGGYRAPELLLREPPEYSNKVDIWAYGCIFFELLSGTCAFSNDFAVYTHYRSQKWVQAVSLTTWLQASIARNERFRSIATFSANLAAHFMQILQTLLQFDGHRRQRIRDWCILFEAYIKILDFEIWQIHKLDRVLMPYSEWSRLFENCNPSLDSIMPVLAHHYKELAKYDALYVCLVAELSKEPGAGTVELLQEACAEHKYLDDVESAILDWRWLVSKHVGCTALQNALEVALHTRTAMCSFTDAFAARLDNNSDHYIAWPPYDGALHFKMYARMFEKYRNLERFRDVALDLGYELDRRQLHEEAIKVYTEILKVYPDTESIQNSLMRACQHSGNSDCTMAVYTELLTIHPEKMWIRQAFNEMWKGHVSPESLSVWKRLFPKCQRNKETQLSIARLCEETGNPRLIAWTWETIVDSNPTDADCRVGLYDACEKYLGAEEKLKIWVRLVDRHPTIRGMQTWLGCVLKRSRATVWALLEARHPGLLGEEAQHNGSLYVNISEAAFSILEEKLGLDPMFRDRTGYRSRIEF